MYMYVSIPLTVKAKLVHERKMSVGKQDYYYATGRFFKKLGSVLKLGPS